MENMREIKTAKAPPKKQFRAGGVKCAVWENEANGIKTLSAVFSRSYKDKSGEWHDSDGFFVNDLPKLRLLAEDAYDFMLREGKE